MLYEPNLKEIKSIVLEEKDLGLAIKRLHSFLMSRPSLAPNNTQLESIENDYRLMCDFMLRGFHDAERDNVYNNLLRKTYRLACDMELQVLTGGANTSLQYAANATGRQSLSLDAIRNQLEGFVQESAMLSLEGNEALKERQAELALKHQQYVNWLFNCILVSPQMSDGQASHMTQLILSPTIDSVDSRMMVSALMLSAMIEFDVCKLRVLKEVYQQAPDEYLKQRALVGFAFALPLGDFSLFPQLKEIVTDFCNDENACRELMELQMQMFFCMNTDRDNAAIQRDIIPTIMKNNNFHVTRFGIEEKEEDPMQDVLHPDAVDKAMEELEQSINKMINMQKAGTDVYFSGFAQMKRFSFFYTLSNWFIPFYLDHPGISQVIGKFQESRFLQILFESGPFCDSDKYSFALAMSSVIDKLPANLREMINSREALGPTMPDGEKQSPAYIRRMYLQDLYRFFRVYQQKTDFETPFEYADNPARFFFANPVMGTTNLRNEFAKMGRFLVKQKRYDCLRLMLEQQTWPEGDPEHHSLKALLAMSEGRYADAKQHFSLAIAMQPDNEQLLKGLAQASLRCGDFVEAEKNYSRLVDLHPDNRQFMLNLSIAKINIHKADEGVKLLYKLNYEHPDDLNVKRALGWGLLLEKNVQQAENTYDSLTSGSHEAIDCLNAGYSKWFAGKIEAAVELFHEYAKADTTGTDKTRIMREAFDNDSRLFDLYEISTTDRAIMANMVDQRDA